MKELTTPEIRKRLLDILVVFREFCQENNLNFYLCAGTLLGAVRHGGFIPWDDDIDVAMLRDDYDKLLDIARDNPIIKDKYKIISYELGTSHYPFLKILDMETQTIQSFSDEGHNNSLWIDIFPFDDVSENTELRKKQYRKVGILREILMLNFAKFGKFVLQLIITVLILVGVGTGGYFGYQWLQKQTFQIFSPNCSFLYLFDMSNIIATFIILLLICQTETIDRLLYIPYHEHIARILVGNRC